MSKMIFRILIGFFVLVTFQSAKYNKSKTEHKS